MAAKVIPLKRVVKKTTSPKDISRPDEDVAFQPIRCAIDWFTLLYRAVITHAAWKRLVELAGPGGRGTLTFEHEGEKLPCVLRLLAGGSLVRIKGPGFYAVVQNPINPPRDRLGVTYPVEVQVQGTLLSRSTNGIATVRWCKAAVETLLYKHEGATPEARAEHLREACFPGRFDIATDVAVVADNPETAQAWINREVFADGNINTANDRISTRARKPKGATEVQENDNGAPILQRGKNSRGRRRQASRMVGEERSGRTLYRGGSIVELCIYERGRKKDGDWPTLESTLKTCGWDGVSPVLRWEVRHMRAWFREQVIYLGGVEWKRANALSVDDLLEHITDFARLGTTRFRHVEAGTGRVRDRASSPYHDAVKAGLGLLESPEKAANLVMDVVAEKRGAALEKAARRFGNAVADIMAFTGLDYWSTVQAVAKEQWDTRAEELEARVLYQRQRYGLEDAPFEVGDPGELKRWVGVALAG